VVFSAGGDGGERSPEHPPQSLAGSEICDLLRGCAPNVYHRSMIIVPHAAPEGYEWFVTLVVLVCLHFAVRNLMRARR
jgi:hypothetical protein